MCDRALRLQPTLTGLHGCADWLAVSLLPVVFTVFVLSAVALHSVPYILITVFIKPIQWTISSLVLALSGIAYLVYRVSCIQ